MVPVSVPGGGLLGQLFSVDVPVRTAALGTRRQRCFWRSLLLPVSLHRFSVCGREKEREEREREQVAVEPGEAAAKACPEGHWDGPVASNP